MKTLSMLVRLLKHNAQAIDDYFEDPAKYEQKREYYLDEVSKASHRDYTTAFYCGRPDGNQQVYTNNSISALMTYWCVQEARCRRYYD